MLALADGGFDQAEAFGVERGRGLIVHLVRSDLDHLVFEIDGATGRTHLSAAKARGLREKGIIATDMQVLMRSQPDENGADVV